MKMKNALWNSLSFLAFLGILAVVVVFAIIFFNPYTQFNPLPPPTLPAALLLPTHTSTQPRLPATWTPEGEDEQVVLPGLKPSSTQQGEGTGIYVIPTRTPSPSVTQTRTVTATIYLYKTTVSSGGYGYATGTKTATPTKTLTPTKNLTSTALSQFATSVRQTQIAATLAASSAAATQTVAALPPNPSSATEIGGASSDVWQGSDADPAFTWAPPSGAIGYNIYWGNNPLATTANYTSASPVFDPPAVTSGTYYLRLQTLFSWAVKPEWTTVFVFRYDGTSPTNPTQAVETQSVQSGVWQKDVSDPSFTWTAATDTHSGVAGYDVYFGPTLEPNPTPTVTPTPSGSDFVDKPEYDPAGVSSGKYVLIIRTVDQVGNLSAWVKLFDFWYDGDNPPTPGNLTTADPATDSTPTFTWDAVTDAHSGLDVYQIYWGTDGACGTKNQPDTTSASFTAPEITSSGVPYLLCVRARDRAGNLSDWAQTTFTYTP